MSKIKMLDELTIQKIAAGEIIERPSSIVKELIENSMDANSNNITVEIRNGGKSYIRVTDDGDGILEDDLKIAFKRHSTSKLSNVDDLFRIMSFGFRGEALASISTVSKVEVLTKTHGNAKGIQAFIEEGEIIKQMPTGCPKGTTMIVKDLFYNIPVRAKFLKTDIAEANNVSDIIYRLALGNYGISFKYIKDNKVIIRTSKNNDLISNIYTLLGKDFSDNLIEINHKGLEFNIHGYISNNTFYRGNRNHQYLYVNNRYIKNDHISNIIEDRYKSMIPINKFPVYILFIDIDPSFIDVNIHPTKQQIKFINQKQIDAVLENIINSTLKSALSIPNTLFKQDKKDTKIEDIPLLYEEIYLQNNNKTQVDDKYIYETKDYKASISEILDDELDDGVVVYEKDSVQDEPVPAPISVPEKPKEDENKEDKIDVVNVLKRLKPIGVIFSTYILAEDTELNKLLIIDQHAAHERVMYEKYLKEFQNEKIVIQNLLTPEIVELTNAEIAIVMDNIELLKKLGFIVDEFGTNSVIIRGVPIMFGKPQVKKLFLELIDAIKLDIKSSYDVKLNKIFKIACTNAIKSGDKIRDIEIQSLFDQLSKTENPYTCPHGRPTIIEISKEDIEKEFKRIM